jgi:hypothetical protein
MMNQLSKEKNNIADRKKMPHNKSGFSTQEPEKILFSLLYRIAKSESEGLGYKFSVGISPHVGVSVYISPFFCPLLLV